MQNIVFYDKNFFWVLLLFFILINLLFTNILYVRAAQVQHVIITTVDNNSSNGSYSWIAEAKSGGSRLNEHNMMPTISDIRVAAYGQYYFILEGGNLNRITLFDCTSLDEEVYQYKTDATPWDMIFIDEHKAYLLMNESSNVLIVDPLALDDDNFNIGTLDLSAYNDDEGVPEICCGIVVGTKAFIGLQRLAAKTSYLAVFDTETDLPINTGKDSGSLLGIPLSIKNPISISYLSQTHRLYVHGSGTIDSPDYSGGILSIDPNSYSTTMVVDDGDETIHPYGYITGMAILSDTDGFFIGATDPNDNTLYHFNPSSGSNNGSPELVSFSSATSDFMQHKRLSGLTGGIGFDQRDRLWIGNITDRQVEIIITTPNQGLYASDGSYQIPNSDAGEAMFPTQIVYCLEPAITDVDESQKPSSSGEGGNFCFIGILCN